MLEIGARPAEFEPARARDAIDHDLGCTLVEDEIGVGDERVDAKDFGVDARMAAGLVDDVGLECGVVELRVTLPSQVERRDLGHQSVLADIAAQLALAERVEFPEVNRHVLAGLRLEPAVNMECATIAGAPDMMAMAHLETVVRTSVVVGKSGVV